MTEFTIHTIDSAPEAAKPILQQLQERVGFVPNLAATMAGSPQVLEAYASLSAAYGRSSFSAVEREIIPMVTSIETGCTYCMAAHTTFAKASGADERVLQAVREGQEPDDPRTAALVRFTRQVAQKRGQASSEDVQAFLKAGFTQVQVMDVLIGVMQNTFASMVFRMAGTPLDAGFQPQQWTPGR